VHDVEQLVRQHELEPFPVLQQLALVRRRQENHRVVERQGGSQAVGEIGGVEHDQVDARGRAPAQQGRDARQDALGGAGHRARLVAVALGEMHREGGGLERAPAQAWIDERQLGPLGLGRGEPGK
jgi:hypothetical protein